MQGQLSLYLTFFCLTVVFFHSKTIGLTDIEDTLRLEALVGCDAFFHVCVSVCIYVCMCMCFRVCVLEYTLETRGQFCLSFYNLVLAMQLKLSELNHFGPKNKNKAKKNEERFYLVLSPSEKIKEKIKNRR